MDASWSCCAKPPAGTPFRVVWRTSADVVARGPDAVAPRSTSELGVADHERYLEALEIDSL
jgi:hypothetical protein